MVTTVDRGRYTVVVDPEGERRPAYAVKARELGRKGVVVGDHVRVVGDTSGEPDALARIVAIDERSTILRRTADDTDAAERVIVANADQLAIVTSVADPEPRPRLIDRYVVAGFAAGMEPLLVVTKTDLASADDLVSHYADLGITAVSTERGASVDHVLERLTDRVTVLVGHSGVGKSTLVNLLVPDAQRRTGDVNDVTGRGRHTSTSAIALPLPSGGWAIDTPGIRSLGLAHVTATQVVHAFPDIEAATADCPRGCTHDEPECALTSWGATDPAREHRVDSVRRLLRALASNDPW